MNRQKVLIVGLLALAAVLLFMTLRPSKPVVRKTEPAVAKEGKKPSAPEQTAARTGRTNDPARAQATQMVSSTTGSTEAVRPAVTPREKAAATWETLVDQVIAQKDVPAAEQAQRVKDAFDKLDKEDQMDGVNRALNLVPDEQFPALYAILFDKTEDPDVLDAIFSDALNRPEEIKNPLMTELRKDREHPLFFESARILDVVEPEEAKAPQKGLQAGLQAVPRASHTLMAR